VKRKMVKLKLLQKYEVPAFSFRHLVSVQKITIISELRHKYPLNVPLHYASASRSTYYYIQNASKPIDIILTI